VGQVDYLRASPHESRITDHSDVVHEERLEPPHLSVPEPKPHEKLQEGASTRKLEVGDAGNCRREHEGPGVPRGWAMQTGQFS